MAKTYGVEIAQGGVDVTQAADYQKVLDSRWEFMEIAMEYQYNIAPGNPGFPVKLFDHNLGHLPAFTQTQPVVFGVARATIVADDTSFYVFPDFVNTPVGFLRIYTCDITAEYQAPIETVSGSGFSVSPDGIKILRQNTNDINSTNPSDFSVSTNARPLSIHLHGIRAVNPSNSHLLFTHNVGYPPTYFVTPVGPFGTHLPQNTIKGLTETFGFATANSYQIDIRGAQSGLAGNYAVMILKDPIEVAS